MIRRQTLAALQASPADLPLQIANAVLCQPQNDVVLNIIARTLGITPRTYAQSEDAGTPWTGGDV